MAFSGVPSVRAKPTALKLLPVRVRRATADFSLMRLTHYSIHSVSPLTSSLFSVT